MWKSVRFNLKCLLGVTALYGLLLSGPGQADGSGVLAPFPETGAFSATFREDRGAISIIELAGNYDREVNGEGNVEPRAVVAREFFRTHVDDYDFLITFTTFEFDTRDAMAFHWGMQNQVQGIGIPLYDVTDLFGSAGRLQGYIDMAALTRYVTDPLNPAFEGALGTLGHEILHQWSGNVRFDQGFGPDDSLLGRNKKHWSNLLDTNGSVLHGHDWRNNGDGTFTSVSEDKFFSPLDLYLAGFYRADEVPPMLLIDNPAVDPIIAPWKSLLLHGPTISGTARTVTIDDIIAAEGPRIPAAAEAQKDFRFAFVLIAGPGETVTQDQITAIDRVRRAFVDRFALWTGGRGTANAFVQALPDNGVSAPGTVEGGDPRTGAANVAEAFAWLRSQQQLDGFWQDKPLTALRDTAVVAEVLSRFDAMFAREADASAWLSTQASDNSDFLARQLAVLNELQGGSSMTAQRDALLALQNSNGSWGIGSGFEGNPLDTALAVLALAEQADIATAVDYLLLQQNTDGGWGNHVGSPSRTTTTTIVLQALRKARRLEAVQTAAVQYLAAKQNADGGFGDSPSTVHDTANALNILTDLNALADVRTSDAATYLLTRQGVAGDWNGSTYATALAAQALQRFSFSNWVLESFTAAPLNPSDGERVQLNVRIANDTNIDAVATQLSVYNGDPATGGTLIASALPVPALPAGQATNIAVVWDTLGLAGTHQLFAVVDPNNTRVETSERDNRARIDITVNAAPAGIDLAIAQSDAAVIPANPIILPSNLGFAATVRNIGLTDAMNVRVQLRLGSALGPVLDEQVLTIANRSSIAVNFAYTLSRPGLHRFVLVADGDNFIPEAREDNNAVALDVGTANSLDLAVSNTDISADTSSTIIGDDVSFAVTLRNRGTTDSPSFITRYTITDGTQTIELASNSVLIAAGQSITQNIVWRVDREGALTFSVQLDPDNLLPELAEDNNTASLAFVGGQAVGPNLTVGFADFTFNPNPGLEGQPLLLSALVRNTGTVAANDVAVAFYNGDPAAGGVLIESVQTISSLAAGAETTVSLNWPAVPDSLEKLLYVVLDPENLIAEFSEQDNRAFNTLAILSLPDLSVSAADIQLSPAFPRLGDAVSLTARVANFGQQAVGNALVRVFDGDPAAGGRQLGTDQLLTVAGNADALLNLSFTFTGDEVLRSLFVVVDPDAVVAESNELNNTAQRDIAVQDGAVAISQRYISPNGDGIQDSTQLFFRLQAPTDVEVQIINSADEVVRQFAGGELNGSTGGELLWDGLDERGRVVADDTYRIQMLAADATVLGEAIVVVDNNRSPLLSALGTPYASLTNLSCQFGDTTGFQLSRDEQSVVFALNENEPGSALGRGIYRMAANGTAVQTLVSDSQLTGWFYSLNLHINSDASEVAFFATVDGINDLWVVSGDGGNLRQLPILGFNVLGFNATDDGVLYYANDAVYQRLLNGAPGQIIANLQDPRLELPPFRRAYFSPNREQVLIELGSGGGTAYLFHADLRTGLTQMLSTVRLNTLPFSLSSESWHVGWAQQGERFAVVNAANRQVEVYNAEGGLLSTAGWPITVSNSDEFVVISNPSLADSGNELAFVQYKGFAGYDPSTDTGMFTEGGIFVLDVETGSISRAYEYQLRDPAVRISGIDIIEGLPAKDFYTGLSPVAEELIWLPGGRTALYSAEGVVSSVALGTGSIVENVFEQFRDDARALELSAAARLLLFKSGVQANDSGSICFDSELGNDSDHWSFKSLLNLTADLRVVRSSTQGGVLLSGSAADLNFNNYRLDYANSAMPDVWRPLQAASSQPLIDGDFTTWVPPSAGSFLVRLTASDLAGNERRQIKRVNWSETQSITDLARSPALFSPNGDGVLDSSNIQYRVLVPVHLEFNFYNVNDDLVRTVVRDHSTVGAVFAFDWDGRDNNGILLPDGRYRMTVQNYEFFFEIDATAPVVQFSLSDAYQSDTSGNVVVTPSLQWRVTEPLYADSVIERSALSVASGWTEFFDPDPSQVGTAEVVKRPLSLTVADNAAFRHRVEDRAGNVTLSQLGPIAEQLIVHGFGAHEITAEGGVEQFSSLQPVAFSPLSNPNGAANVMIVGNNQVRFDVAETVRNSLSAVSVQYRPLTQSAWIVDDVNALFDAQDVPNEILTTENIAHEFQAVWRPADIDPAVTYAVRLQARDSTGNTVFSNVLQVRFATTLFFNGLRRDADDALQLQISAALESPAQAGDYVLWGSSTGRVLESVRVFVRSDDDPRYAITQEIGVVSNVDGVYALKTDQLSSCRQYVGYAEGERAAYIDPELGEVPASIITTGERAFSTPCIDLIVKSEPVAAQACNVAGPGQVRVRFAPISLDGNALSLLSLSTDDINNVLFNVNQPDGVGRAQDPSLQQYNYEFLLDISAVAEGNVPYQVRLVNINNEEIVVPLNVVVDRTPPVVTVNFPAEGARVCGVQRTHEGELNSVLTLDGLIQDANRIHYTVHKSSTEIFNSTAAVLLHDSRSLSSFFPASPIKPIRPDFHSGDVIGPFAEIANENGPRSIRLSVYDQGGFQQCVDRSFVFDGLVELSEVGLSRNLFSPNGDLTADTVDINYSITENVSLDIDIYAALEGAGGVAERGPAVLRNLVTAQPVLAGTASVTWDGTDDTSVVLADGNYMVVATFTDACGNQREEEMVVEIDNTPPTIKIDFPTAAAALPQIVEVQGSIDDINIDEWQVEFGIGNAPESWVRLNRGAGKRDREILANWNTFGLGGPYTLRIQANDTVGNVGQQLVTVNVDVPLNIISYFEAVENLISPNADGRRDNSSIRFGLEQPALVSLSVYNTSDVLLEQLLTDASFNSGPAVEIWDGLNSSGLALPDGEYRIRLSAALQSNPLVRQEEQITVELDSTAPTVSITRPANGFVRGVGSVLGTIADNNMQQFTVELADNPVAPLWQLLTTSINSRVDAPLAVIQGLAEGDYALRFRADDQTGNAIEEIIPFVVDNTAPLVNISAPQNNMHLSAANGPHAIECGFEEDNPALLQLRYGVRGSDPAGFTSLLSMDTFSTTSISMNWDIAAVADAEYTLQCVLEDQAGFIVTAETHVTVDNTLPLAGITAPAAGDYITAVTVIAGTASDTNLLEYLLDIAPGPQSAAQAFSTIGSGTTSVSNADLSRWSILPVDGLYTLRLSVFDRAGNSRQDFVEVTVDTQPPAAPQVLTGEVLADRTVRLSWQANTETDLQGYQVYKNDLLLTPSLITGTEFIDADLASGTARYTVRAVDLAGQASAASAPLELVIDFTPPQVGFVQPVNTGTVSGLVDIRGTAFSADDFAEYRLYVAALSDPGSRQLLRQSPLPVQADTLAEWDTFSLADAAQYVLTLEADDIHTNTATASITVSIDNTAPAQPGGLTAVATASDVALSWDVNTETDLAGYLLFRNGRLANATTAVVGDLTPFIIQANSYTDAGLADGEYRYTVVAVDEAGNLSIESNPAVVQIDQRVPQAAIVQPAANTAFDQPIYLLATSADSDIASVRFEFRAQGAVTWTGIADDLAAPFGADFDPALFGLSFGLYEFRAVATDSSAQTDPAPTIILLDYTDITRPAAVSNFVASVNGGDVALSWDASSAADFLEYQLIRNAGGALTTFTTVSNSFNDLALEDDAYQYLLRVVDQFGNESDAVVVLALVFTPQLQQPTATTAATVEVQGSSPVAGTVSAEVNSGTGSQVLPAVATAADGSFVFTVPLERGQNQLTVRVTDAAGNVSNPAVVSIGRGDAISAPTGLLANVTGFDVALSWNANPEPFVAGYRVYRDGVGVNSTLISGNSFIDTVSDGVYSYSVTAVSDVGLESEPSIAVSAAVGDVTPPDPIFLNADSYSNNVELFWDRSLAPDAAGYEVYRNGELLVTRFGVFSTYYEDRRLADGSYVYTVTVLDFAGNRSLPSNAIEITVGDSPTGAEITPALFMPTGPGIPITLAANTTDIAGFATPAANVELQRNGVGVAQTLTLSASEAVSSAQAGNCRFAQASPDARYLLCVPSTLGSRNQVLLYEFGIGTEQLLLTAQGNYLQPYWFNDGQRFLYTDTDPVTENRMVWSYDLATGASEALTDPAEANVYAAVPAPNGERIAIAARVGSGASAQSGLFVYQADTASWTLLAAFDATLIDRRTIAWSPDGRYLTYQSDSDFALMLADTQTSALTVIDANGAYDQPGWAPDSSRLVYSSAADDQLYIYDVVSSSSTLLSDPNAFDYFYYPQWSPDGRFIVYYSDNWELLFVLNLQTGVETRLIDADYVDYEQTQWTANGYVTAQLSLAGSGALYHRVSPAGRFEFNDVTLLAGTNTFTAHTLDSAGLPQVSENIVVNNTLTSADLLIEVTDIRVIPSATVASSDARINITVRNRGGSDAVSSDLNLIVRNAVAANVLTASNVPVPMIAAGGSYAVGVDWAIPSEAGVYTIIVAADATNRVAESDEQNNSAVLQHSVADIGGLALSIRTDQSSYAANEPVNISAAAINAGLAFNGYLEVFIEDSFATPVTVLSSEAITPFDFNARQERAVSWSPAGILAGEYRAGIRVFNGDGHIVQTEYASFVIQPSSSLSATLTTDQSAYAANSNVRLNAGIHYLAGNTILSGAIAQLQIRDNSGAVIFSTAENLVDLLPGASAATSALWNNGVRLAGIYQAVLNVIQGTDVVQTVVTEFVINATTQLSGAFVQQELFPDIGSPQNVGFTVSSQSNADITGLPLLVSLRDVATQSILQSQTVSADIALGATFGGSVSFDTSGLGLRSYVVLLQANVPGVGLINLASADVLPQDRVAPVVSVVQPAANGFINAGADLRFTATDNLLAIERVEYQLDGGAWLAAVVRDPSSGQYGQTIPGLLEGVHIVRARATDSFGNTGYSALASFTVDDTAPQVSVSGVTDGEARSGAFTPIVSISDANLAESHITLNNQPYVSGTVIDADGAYVLTAFAIDRAGNSNSVTVSFIRDATPPVVTIDGVIEGEWRAGSVLPVITITDDNLANEVMTLNGQPYFLNALISAEDQYLLRVVATDVAGNSTEVEVNFAIDLTPPSITVSGVSDGAFVAAPVTPLIAVSDVGPVNSVITLNGLPFISGTLIDSDDDYQLSVTATDAAGNASQQTVNFVIDQTAPLIVIEGVADGQIGNTVLTPLITITEINPEEQIITLNGNAYVPGTEISAEDQYSLRVFVRDLAGNSSERVIEFVIDTTPPILTVSSPDNGAIVDVSTIDIVGQTEAAAVVSLTDVNNNQISVLADGSGLFRFVDYALVEGDNSFTLQARDAAGNNSDPVSLTIVRLPEINVDLSGSLDNKPRVLLRLPGWQCDSPVPVLPLEQMLFDIFAMENIDYTATYDNDTFWQALYSSRYNVTVIADVRDKQRFYCAKPRRDDDDDDDDRDDRDEDDDHDGDDDDDRDDDYGDDDDDDRLMRRNRIELDDDLLSDLKLNVAAGMGLVVLTNDSDDDDLLPDVMGAKLKGHVRVEQLEIVDSPLGSAATLALNARAVALKPKGGLVIGQYTPKTKAALVINSYYGGNTVLAGFDPAALSDTVAAEALLLNILRFSAPVDYPLIPGGVAGVNWIVDSVEKTFSAELTQSAGTELNLLQVADGDIVNAQTAFWQRIIVPPASRFASLLQLPEHKGSFVVNAEVFESRDGTLRPLETAELLLDVQQERLEIGQALLDKLAAIQPASRAERKKLQYAIAHIQAALALELNSRHRVETAMWKLKVAYRKLERMQQDIPLEMKMLGTLWRTYQLEWLRY